MEFPCPDCNKVYHHRSSLFKHRRQKHNHQVSGTARCLEEGCGASFYGRKNLRDHLSSIHQLPMRERRLDFESHSGFLQWKQQYEKDNRCAFVKLSGSNTTFNKRTQMYCCSRSGYYKSKGTGARALKSQGSSKIDCHCTAGITASTDETSGKVCVLLTDTHYGHEKALRRLKLAPTDRTEIGQKLLQGVSVDKILEDVRDSPKSSLERKHLLTRTDIKNIERSLGIQRDDNDDSSVDIRVNTLGGDGASTEARALNINGEPSTPSWQKHDVERISEEFRDLLAKADDRIGMDAIFNHLEAAVHVLRCSKEGN